jgi:hypothetical protein
MGEKAPPTFYRTRFLEAVRKSFLKAKSKAKAKARLSIILRFDKRFFNGV